MGAEGESLHELFQSSSPRPSEPSAPAPPPLDLRRALSTPTGSVTGPLQPILSESLRRLPEDGRRRPRKSPDEGRLALARAVEALASKVDGLGAQMEEERSSSFLREANISRLAEVLATAVENAALTPLPPSFDPMATERTIREEDIEAVVENKARARDERLLEAITGIGAKLERQILQQEKQLAIQQRILEEKASSEQVLQEAVEAVRSLKTVEPGEPPKKTSICPCPRYRPHLGADGRLYEFPEVQVALKINQICNVDTKQLTFEADFVCFLDWFDPNVATIPSDDLKTLDWSSQYFNPQIEVDNAKDKGGWLDGQDSIPRRPRTFSGGDGTGSLDSAIGSDYSLSVGPRLRKTMRFKGVLSMGTVNLKCFPFDIQMLPITLKAARCRGLAGRVSRVQLVRGDGPPSPTCLESDIRAEGHYVMPSAGDALLEFRICGLTGYHPERQRGDIYDVSVFVARPFFASYFWDLVIMNLFVMLAATAFWDTASPELSSRMSISLTVILTLAAYTSSRPEPIAKAPYVTFHDWMEQNSMFLVTGISAQNVFAVVMCGGQNDEAPPYMIEEFQANQESCSLGWCKSRAVDCRGLVILLVTWLLLTLYSCIWLVRSRHRATRELRERFPPASFRKSHGTAVEALRKGHSGCSLHSLDSWSAKARHCLCLCFGCAAHCCKKRACCRGAEEVSRADDAGERSPESANARSTLVGGLVAGTSPESSSVRPRPRPLTFDRDVDAGGASPKGSSPSSDSPHESAVSSPRTPQVHAAPQPSRTPASASPPTSARFGVPSSTSPAATAAWHAGLAPVSPSPHTSSFSSVSHETSVSSRRPFFS